MGSSTVYKPLKQGKWVRQEPGWYTMKDKATVWHVLGRSGTPADRWFRKAWVIETSEYRVDGKRTRIGETDTMKEAKDHVVAKIQAMAVLKA